MRLAYAPLPYGRGTVGRPCVELRFGADPNAMTHLALVDSGSVRTIIPRCELDAAGVALGPEVERLGLRFGGIAEGDVPVHLLDVTVVSPDLDWWEGIELPQIPVACCETQHLPVLILGSSALLRLVVLLREHDQVLHLKAWEQFAQAPHFTDDEF